jgi:hypothetical protein
VFEASFVKVVPTGTFWTACFNLIDPVVDVDMVLPVQWFDDALEEVDLELDVVQCGDGSVRLRDRDEFDRVRAIWAMPDNIANEALATSESLGELVARATEPFGEVGLSWLRRFVAAAD